MNRTRYNAEKDLEDDASSKLTLIIDLNIPNPDTLKEDNTHGSTSDPGSCIDWARGSIDIAEDGRLNYVHGEPTGPPQRHEIDAAVQEAELAEEARRHGDVKDDEQNVEVDDEAAGRKVEDSLWTFRK